MSLGTSRLEFFIDKGIVFVEENNGVEGLTLGGSGDILLSYRMGQEVFNVLLTHISRMGFLISDFKFIFLNLLVILHEARLPAN